MQKKSLEIISDHHMVSVFNLNLVKRVPEPYSLFIASCKGLKDVFNLKEIWTSFSRLEKMKLHDLPILENIWKGSIPPVGCFRFLTTVEVCRCEKLRYLFSTSMAMNLQNLKELRIEGCKGMVKLIASEGIMVYHDEDDQLPCKIFPNLKQLKILDCKNLEQLCDGKNLEKEEEEEEDQLPDGRAFILDSPCLEHLEVSKCENLKRILLTHKCTKQLKRIIGDSREWFEEVLEWENPNDKLHMRALFFHGEWLKDAYLQIKSAHYMVSVFNLNLVKRVPELKTLSVASCDGLKDVFSLEETGTSTYNIDQYALSGFTSSKLRVMLLENLPNLENIWKGYIPSVGCFENLEVVMISECHKLRYLFSLFMAMNLQNLKELRIEGCKGMVKLIASAEEDPLMSFKIFPKLKYLRIASCENLKHLWDIGMNLEKKEDDDADDQLVMGRTSTLDFPYLEYLQVVKCENLEKIHLTHQCTQKLKEIEGDSEEWFDEVLEWENPTDKSNMKPLFTKH